MHKNIRYFLFYSIFLILSSRTNLFGIPSETGQKRIIFITNAIKYLGTPYRYGGRSEQGMDCSGFVYRCAADILALQLPRQSDVMAEFANIIEEKDIQPGDLLFFNTTGRISHTGIYIGAGMFIHAASDGPRTGVIISAIQEPYWKKAYRQAGRIMPAEDIFTTEAKLPLVLRTEKNSALHPDIAAALLKQQNTSSSYDTDKILADNTTTEQKQAVSAAVPSALPVVEDSRTLAAQSLFIRKYGFRIGILYGFLWDWNRAEDIFRGIAAHIEFAWATKWVSPGASIGIYWDHRTGSVSTPFSFYLEFFEQLRLYTGYQHHFFTHPTLSKTPVFPNIAGIAWHSLPLRAGMQHIRLFQAIEYSYVKNTPLERRFRFLTGVSFNFYKEIS